MEDKTMKPASNEPYFNAPGWTADISGYSAAPGTVASTITNLAAAIEILAYDAMFTDTFPEGRRLGAIEAIARCIGELSAPLPEIIDKMSEKSA